MVTDTTTYDRRYIDGGYMLPARSSSRGEVLEPGELADERELDRAGGTVALFADDQLGHALGIGRRLILVGVLILAIDEQHHIGVLLEGARFAQVRQLRA